MGFTVLLFLPVACCSPLISRCMKFTVVRPGGLTVEAPTGVINVIKGEVRSFPLM